MTEPRKTEEQHDARGKPMVAATPRDVVHVRLGSFGLVIAIAVAVIAGLSQVWWLMIIGIVAAAAIGVDMYLATRRQRTLGGGPQSEAG
ncbi:hypothetical protein [Herbidospora mongoliensis]|uniref:hypothetical protein n=1 Tax=Herbidospora mongoliensis TaxID=688067 RepID=UPI00082E4A29|nr:hypothetical protein [Herbidospora mongoliensis]